MLNSYIMLLESLLQLVCTGLSLTISCVIVQIKNQINSIKNAIFDVLVHWTSKKFKINIEWKSEIDKRLLRYIVSIKTV